MKNKLLAIMMGVMLSISLVGCGSSSTPESIDNQEYVLTGGRLFIRIDYDDGILLIDRDTRVQYFTYGFGYYQSMSVLVDADGKPILYEGELK